MILLAEKNIQSEKKRSSFSKAKKRNRFIFCLWQNNKLDFLAWTIIGVVFLNRNIFGFLLVFLQLKLARRVQSTLASLCPLSSILQHRSISAIAKEIFGNAENQTQVRLVRSKNPTSVLCSPPKS